MKILIVSDIHGDYDTFNKVISSNNFDRLIVLGDLFAYLDIPSNLEDNPIIKLLVKYKDKLILIRGNCDQYIDFKSVDLTSHEEITMHLNNYVVTMTHGDKYNKNNLPKYHGNIFLSGHTHIPLIKKDRGIIYANPGSIGRPRGYSPKSYLLFTDDELLLLTVENILIKSFNLKSNNF